MPRSMWNGSIGFGLVNVPVELVPATRDLDYHFRELHEPDASPVRHQRICSDEGRPIDWDEVGKGFELDNGELVVLTEDELREVEPEKNRTIEIESFARLEEIDPIRFNRGYFLVPRDSSKGTVRAYGLLVEAMADAGLAALGRFVMRTKEYLAAIRELDGALALSTMYYPDEIRSFDQVPSPEVAVDDPAVEDALAVIQDRRVDWDPGSWEDCYRERLKRVIDAKLKGGTVRPPDTVSDEELEPVPDLMAALKKTLEKSGKRRGRKRPGTDDSPLGAGALSSLSRAELYDRAKEKRIEGRSSMTKKELVAALTQ
jgi:DNA end-binding protein Ku